LTATVKPGKTQFQTNERLHSVVSIVNRSAQEVRLEVHDFLGSQELAKYTASFRNTATGETWRLWQNPALPQPGAPARSWQETIKPGATLPLVYSPYGWFSQGQADGAPWKTAPHLPAGDYELVLTIEIGEVTITPKPAAFKMMDPAAAPSTKADKEKIVATARQALAQKLARQIQAEKDSGSSLPGGARYASLTSEAFTASVEPAGTGQIVKFSAELPDSEAVLTWSVVVSDKGVDPNFGMLGFTVTGKTEPARRPVQ